MQVVRRDELNVLVVSRLTVVKEYTRSWIWRRARPICLAVADGGRLILHDAGLEVRATGRVTRELLPDHPHDR